MTLARDMNFLDILYMESKQKENAKRVVESDTDLISELSESVQKTKVDLSKNLKQILSKLQETEEISEFVGEIDLKIDSAEFLLNAHLEEQTNA